MEDRAWWTHPMQHLKLTITLTWTCRVVKRGLRTSTARSHFSSLTSFSVNSAHIYASYRHSSEAARLYTRILTHKRTEIQCFIAWRCFAALLTSTAWRRWAEETRTTWRWSSIKLQTIVEAGTQGWSTLIQRVPYKLNTQVHKWISLLPNKLKHCCAVCKKKILIIRLLIVRSCWLIFFYRIWD